MTFNFASFISSLSQLFTSPIQIGILIGIVFVIRRFILHRRQERHAEDRQEDETPPPLDKQDFTLEDLRDYDGVTKPNILIAVHGKVFDVSRSKEFYGPGGPYSVFAGRDASRGLATFSTDPSALRDTYDDLSDMNTLQMESVIEWELQFTEKYDLVGKLLKPGEKPTNYRFDESEDENKSSSSKKND